METVKNGVLENHSRRDLVRAPSFPWASLVTPHGIIHGETTDYGEGQVEQLLFEAEDCAIVLVQTLQPSERSYCELRRPRAGYRHYKRARAVRYACSVRGENRQHRPASTDLVAAEAALTTRRL